MEAEVCASVDRGELGLEELKAPGLEAEGDWGGVDPATRVTTEFLDQILAHIEFFQVKGIGDKHPATASIPLLDSFQHFFIIRLGTGNSHALHVARGVGVGEGLVFIDGFAESLSYEIRQANSQGVALGMRGKAKSGNDVDSGPGQILKAVNSAAANDICIHAGSAVGLSDFVDDQNPQIVAREGGEIVAVAFEQSGLLLKNLWPGDGMNLRRLI